MIDRAQEINGSPDLTVEDLGARLRSQFSAFPDQQLQMMLQCRHPSAEYSRFDREDIEQSIAGRFQQQVANFPNRLAVRTGSESLTYAGLNEAANRVAWQLLWAVPDVTRVGVLLDHGLSAVVGYLGVMKAGKVCVFLDRGGPRERARAIVENAGLGCVISDEGGLESLRELGFSSGQIVTIADCHRQPTANPDLEIRPSAPAEITYTSGSTGLPKGIVHSHRNRLHKAWIVTNALQICPDDRIALLHSLTSGPATTDIHEALLNGAALCSFDITQQDMSTLAAWLVDNAITILHWVPSLFRHFGATLLAEDKFSSVRLVMLGSEQATTQDLELIKQHFSDSCVLVNRLGAIETANTRLFFANGRTKLPTGGLPVGYMLPDQRMILVNELGQPVPTGEIGEIVVCSEWLALEYYGQPDLTAAAFFTGPKDGARCFRTGDLGRLEPDGCLEYLGRADGRTKVRGRWVDTAKIETLLAQQPHLAECAVVAREEERSGSRLTAFLVPTAESRLSISQLRSFLLQSIPSDALPSRFLTLARLPRMGTGKLDRRLLSLGTLAALREACGAVEELREAGKFVAPESELEESLTTIWEELFDVSPLGIHDSFFDLGGDSLLAMRLTLRVNLRFECGLSPGCIFSAPTIAQIARILALPRTTKASKSLSTAICPRTAEQRPSLSFGQQRLWFLEQMEGELTAYNMPYAWRLRGPLNPEALRRALEAMVRRHEPLRTTFAVVDGEPVQVIGTIERLELPAEDLCGLATDQQEAEILKRCRKEAERPFDLARDLMLRTSLLRLTEDEQVLLLTLHHIASDGWSMHVVFWRELRVLYDAYCRDVDAGLPDLPVQYTDYALWQRRQLEGERLAGLLQYWREQLDGVRALELPTDRPRPRQPSYRGARYDFTLGPELSQQLQLLGQAECVTLHMTLLAAFQVLLSRYSGQDDIAVGTPTAGRNHAALEGLIGFFVNTLVLRTDLSGDPTFRELLGRARQVSLAAYDHQDLPFEKLVEELQPERHLSRSPLVQVLFQLLSLSDQGLTLGALEVSRLPDSSGRVRFDLEMHVWQPAARGDRLRGTVVYSTELFDAATIERMVGHFVRLLEGIVADADQRISVLPLLTEAERQQLLVEWNDTAVEYPRDRCVHQLFEEQAERTPRAVAVVFKGQELTYREMNERANRLAHHLRSLGVGPETLVGLCTERSLEMAVGVLGILKAGAAYVPLDPTYPGERLAFLLHDTRAPVLVTRAGLSGVLPESSARIVCLDSDWGRLADEPTDNPQRRATLDNLAYILYTSGSTGQPKGVAMGHRPLANLIAWQLANTNLPSSARTLQFASLNFDVSFQEMFATWCSGGSLVLIPEDVHQDPEMLWQLIVDERVNRLFVPFVALQQLVEVAVRQAVGPNSLQEIITAGEQLQITPSLIRFFSQQAGCTLHNQYGPTECHVVTSLTLKGLPADWPALPPIGRPIANAHVYILDAHRQPAPIGVPGEVYLGGICLARGYWNRPDLTAERFPPNPFVEEAGSRLYRTGDLARWQPDGQIEFLGRIDNQVKIRGYRVELGEVETVLGLHPQVRETVVVVREDAPGGKGLVAYVVLRSEPAPTVEELRRFLGRQLPEYMVPSAFVALEALPLTPSGKINRRALPAPDNSRSQLESVYVAPRNPIEEQLSSIWCDVLGIQNIGIHDNFFALGGHSLLVARVAARASAALEVELPLRKLFEAPTIADLAVEINVLRSGAARSPATPLERMARDRFERLPLSFAQQRLWFLEQMDGELSAYNMAFAWRLRGPLNPEALRRALEAMVRRHEPLRTTFAVVDGEPVQVIGTIERLELPAEDLRGLATDQQAAEIVKRSREEAERPFDLTGDLMLRASLLRLAEDEQVLLLTFHHIASDGWSFQVVFWRELRVLYDAYCRDADAGLPDLPVQYSDYAAWQRRQLEGERLAGLLRYWREQLQGVSALELPTDRPRPPRPSYRGARHNFTLTPELSQQLQSLGQAEGVTLHMTLLAAFQTLLSRYSGQEDVAVGTPTAGRNHAALEGLIGFFVNTLVLRTDLSGDPTFRELLGRVRQVSLAAYDHQDLPFEKLVEELQPERHLSRSPLVQVVFQLLSFSGQSLTLRDLEVSRLPQFSGRVRFDLEMYLWQPAAREDNIRGTVVYSTVLFDATTIERMVGHFLTLLEGIVADADQRISDLPLLTEAERQQLLVEWTDTAVEYPQDKCLHQLFEEQMERTPGAVAVVFEGKELTYRELNERANRLAHHLRSLGVGPETLVGLCLDRSLELVIGILGILKAGGAYVPLDPTYPTERLAFLMADAGIGALVTQQTLLPRLSEPRFPVMCLDRDAGIGAEASVAPVSSSVGPEHPAYVIYTSGSTGLPKGVVVTHANVVRLFEATQDWFQFDATDVWTLFHSAAFDFSVWELWGALRYGGRLVVVPYLVSRSPEAFYQLLQREGVTVLNQTPSAFRQLSAAEAALADRPALRLRFVIFGGEALDLRSLHPWFARHGDRTPRLVNMYGITETTVHVTFRPVSAADAEADLGSRIGRPIPDLELYVLDRFQKLVPIGVPGELYVGGAGLARGYLNRSELTAERFLAHPFNHRPGARLYKSGDSVRWRPDGDLEYLGRLDEQVKLRGHRIELGEIQAVLGHHPQVREVVVVVREDRPGDPRLVAYLVSRTEPTPTAAELRSFLAWHLPEYMVPSAFVPLTRVPLTPNGKLDRRVLPAPDNTRPELESVYTAPGNAIEEKLSCIWCDVMGIESIGIHDDFFALGGHSLLAVRLMARIESAFGKKLPLATLFEHPTIAHTARVLQQASQLTRRGALVKIQGEGSRLPLFFPPSIGGEAFFCKPMARHLGSDQPIWSFQVPERDGVKKPFLDIETMAAFFVNELTKSQMPGPYCLAGYSFGATVALEMAQQLWARGERVGLLAILDWGFSTPRPRTIGRLWRSTWASIRNLPFWLIDDFFHTPADNMLSRLFGEIREIVHRVRHPWGTVQRISSGEDSWERALAPEYQVLIETHHRALRQYRPRPYPGRITLFRARARALLSSGRERDLGWGRIARGGVDVRLIPGTHLTMIQEPFVQILAHEMQRALETANKDISRTT